MQELLFFSKHKIYEIVNQISERGDVRQARDESLPLGLGGKEAQ